MDPATIQLVLTGFELAGDLLGYLGKREAATTSTSRDVAALIETSSSRLDHTVRSVARTIVDKLESDKLEELTARTKNLAMIVRMGRSDQVFQYALTLNESVEYARNRLQEGKQRWLGAWLAGHTLFISAMEYAGASNGDSRQEFARAVHTARLSVLDMFAQRLLGLPQPPWEHIAEFTRGESTRLLTALAQSDLVASTPPAAASASEHVVAPSPITSPRPGLPPRSLAAGESYCLGCRSIYGHGRTTKCPKCNRFNHQNASASYPLVCFACRESYQDWSRACAVCSGPLTNVMAR